MKDDESLNPKAHLYLVKFLEGKDIIKISRSLNKVFFDYLCYQREGLPMDFDDILDDIERIFEILELVARYQPTQSISS